MRPRTLDEFVGQEHIVGPGKLLRRAIEADRLFSSIILWGPPGTGKTTLAQVIANHTQLALRDHLGRAGRAWPSCASVIDEARERRRLYSQRTILFVDEVHRWNKAQQDALLPHVENGTVILIGATTENPYFEVIGALVSRSRVFQLKPARRRRACGVMLDRALADPERGYGERAGRARRGRALEHLIDVAGGDARNALNALELAVEIHPARRGRRHPHHAGGRPGIDPAPGRALRQGRRRPLRHHLAPSSSRCAAPTPTRPCTGWPRCSTPAKTRASSCAA